MRSGNAILIFAGWLALAAMRASGGDGR